MSEEKRRKKRKKNSHKLYAFVVLTLGIAIVVMSILLLFHVQVIEISGNEYVSSRDIVADIQKDKYAKNSLYLVGKDVLGKIEFPKAISKAKVRMKTPWKVKITVTEKKMIGYTIVGDEYIYFDEEGRVLEKSVVLREEIPYIKGISVSEATLYEKLPVKEKRLFRNISEALNALKKYKVKPEQIVCEDADITIHIGKVCVQLGSGNMELKISQIPPILKEVKDKEGILDLKHYTESSETISFKEGELPKTDEEGTEQDENV